MIETMFAAENGLKGDPRLEAISAAIRVVPNFPKKGLKPSSSSSVLYSVFLCFSNSLKTFLVFFSRDRDYVSGHNNVVIGS